MVTRITLMLIFFLITSCSFASPQRRRSNSHQNVPTTPCSDECTDGVEMPSFCDYASDLWDDPSTPLSERNNIGMAKYLTSANILKATNLAKLGKVYKLSYPYTNSMPAFGTRSWYTSLRNPASDPIGDPAAYYEFDEYNNTICGQGIGYLDQRLMTSAIGNSGTQFDGLGHIFYVNGDYGDTRNYLHHNGFTGDAIYEEHGINYIGVEQLPPIITRAILLDIAGYAGYDPLPDSYKIDSTVIEDVLQYQGMSVDVIETGDVILIYTGWTNANWGGDASYYYSRAPGITLDAVIDIFGPKKVVLLGSDTWPVESVTFGEATNFQVHTHWIVCHGGFLYENMKLVEWVTDARNGTVPYIGGFYFSPAQIEGGVGGLGTPMVIV